MEVNPEFLSRYMRVVKNPMDFGTMKRKVARAEYTDGESFATDFKLVLHNAKLFNMPNTKVHRLAQYIEEEGGKMVTNILELDPEFLQSLSHPSAEAQEQDGQTQQKSKQQQKEKENNNPEETSKDSGGQKEGGRTREKKTNARAAPAAAAAAAAAKTAAAAGGDSDSEFGFGGDGSGVVGMRRNRAERGRLSSGQKEREEANDPVVLDGESVLKALRKRALHGHCSWSSSSSDEIGGGEKGEGECKKKENSSPRNRISPADDPTSLSSFHDQGSLPIRPDRHHTSASYFYSAPFASPSQWGAVAKRMGPLGSFSALRRGNQDTQVDEDMEGIGNSTALHVPQTKGKGARGKRKDDRYLEGRYGVDLATVPIHELLGFSSAQAHYLSSEDRKKILSAKIPMGCSVSLPSLFSARIDEKKVVSGALTRGALASMFTGLMEILVKSSLSAGGEVMLFDDLCVVCGCGDGGGRLLSCQSCGESVHPACVGIVPDALPAAASSLFRCPACVRCGCCGEAVESGAFWESFLLPSMNPPKRKEGSAIPDRPCILLCSCCAAFTHSACLQHARQRRAAAERRSPWGLQRQRLSASGSGNAAANPVRVSFPRPAIGMLGAAGRVGGGRQLIPILAAGQERAMVSPGKLLLCEGNEIAGGGGRKSKKRKASELSNPSPSPSRPSTSAAKGERKSGEKGGVAKGEKGDSFQTKREVWKWTPAAVSALVAGLRAVVPSGEVPSNSHLQQIITGFVRPVNPEKGNSLSLHGVRLKLGRTLSSWHHKGLSSAGGQEEEKEKEECGGGQDASSFKEEQPAQEESEQRVKTMEKEVRGHCEKTSDEGTTAEKDGGKEKENENDAPPTEEEQRRPPLTDTSPVPPPGQTDTGAPSPSRPQTVDECRRGETGAGEEEQGADEDPPHTTSHSPHHRIPIAPAVQTKSDQNTAESQSQPEGTVEKNEEQKPEKKPRQVMTQKPVEVYLEALEALTQKEELCRRRGGKRLEGVAATAPAEAGESCSQTASFGQRQQVKKQRRSVPPVCCVKKEEEHEPTPPSPRLPSPEENGGAKEKCEEEVETSQQQPEGNRRETAEAPMEDVVEEQAVVQEERSLGDPPLPLLSGGPQGCRQAQPETEAETGAGIPTIATCEEGTDDVWKAEGETEIVVGDPPIEPSVPLLSASACPSGGTGLLSSSAAMPGTSFEEGDRQKGGEEEGVAAGGGAAASSFTGGVLDSNQGPPPPEETAKPRASGFFAGRPSGKRERSGPQRVSMSSSLGEDSPLTSMGSPELMDALRKVRKGNTPGKQKGKGLASISSTMQRKVSITPHTSTQNRNVTPALSAQKNRTKACVPARSAAKSIPSNYVSARQSPLVVSLPSSATRHPPAAALEPLPLSGPSHVDSCPCCVVRGGCKNRPLSGPVFSGGGKSGARRSGFHHSSVVTPAREIAGQICQASGVAALSGYAEARRRSASRMERGYAGLTCVVCSTGVEETEELKHELRDLRVDLEGVPVVCSKCRDQTQVDRDCRAFVAQQLCEQRAAAKQMFGQACGDMRSIQQWSKKKEELFSFLAKLSAMVVPHADVKTRVDAWRSLAWSQGATGFPAPISKWWAGHPLMTPLWNPAGRLGGPFSRRPHAPTVRGPTGSGVSQPPGSSQTAAAIEMPSPVLAPSLTFLALRARHGDAAPFIPLRAKSSEQQSGKGEGAGRSGESSGSKFSKARKEFSTKLKKEADALFSFRGSESLCTLLGTVPRETPTLVSREGDGSGILNASQTDPPPLRPVHSGGGVFGAGEQRGTSVGGASVDAPETKTEDLCPLPLPCTDPQPPSTVPADRNPNPNNSNDRNRDPFGFGYRSEEGTGDPQVDFVPSHLCPPPCMQDAQADSHPPPEDVLMGAEEEDGQMGAETAEEDGGGLMTEKPTREGSEQDDERENVPLPVPLPHHVAALLPKTLSGKCPCPPHPQKDHQDPFSTAESESFAGHENGHSPSTFDPKPKAPNGIPPDSSLGPQEGEQKEHHTNGAGGAPGSSAVPVGGAGGALPPAVRKQPSVPQSASAGTSRSPALKSNPEEVNFDFTLSSPSAMLSCDDSRREAESHRLQKKRGGERETESGPDGFVGLHGASSSSDVEALRLNLQMHRRGEERGREVGMESERALLQAALGRIRAGEEVEKEGGEGGTDTGRTEGEGPKFSSVSLSTCPFAEGAQKEKEKKDGDATQAEEEEGDAGMMAGPELSKERETDLPPPPLVAPPPLPSLPQPSNLSTKKKKEQGKADSRMSASAKNRTALLKEIRKEAAVLTGSLQRFVHWMRERGPGKIKGRLKETGSISLPAGEFLGTTRNENTGSKLFFGSLVNGEHGPRGRKQTEREARLFPLAPPLSDQCPSFLLGLEKYGRDLLERNLGDARRDWRSVKSMMLSFFRLQEEEKRSGEARRRHADREGEGAGCTEISPLPECVQKDKCAFCGRPEGSFLLGPLLLCGRLAAHRECLRWSIDCTIPPCGVSFLPTSCSSSSSLSHGGGKGASMNSSHERDLQAERVSVYSVVTAFELSNTRPCLVCRDIGASVRCEAVGALAQSSFAPQQLFVHLPCALLSEAAAAAEPPCVEGTRHSAEGREEGGETVGGGQSAGTEAIRFSCDFLKRRVFLLLPGEGHDLAQKDLLGQKEDGGPFSICKGGDGRCVSLGHAVESVCLALSRSLVVLSKADSRGGAGRIEEVLDKQLGTDSTDSDTEGESGVSASGEEELRGGKFSFLSHRTGKQIRDGEGERDGTPQETQSRKERRKQETRLRKASRVLRHWVDWPEDVQSLEEEGEEKESRTALKALTDICHGRSPEDGNIFRDAISNRFEFEMDSPEILTAAAATTGCLPRPPADHLSCLRMGSLTVIRLGRFLHFDGGADPLPVGFLSFRRFWGPRSKKNENRRRDSSSQSHHAVAPPKEMRTYACVTEELAGKAAVSICLLSPLEDSSGFASDDLSTEEVVQKVAEGENLNDTFQRFLEWLGKQIGVEDPPPLAPTPSALYAHAGPPLSSNVLTGTPLSLGREGGGRKRRFSDVDLRGARGGGLFGVDSRGVGLPVSPLQSHQQVHEPSYPLAKKLRVLAPISPQAGTAELQQQQEAQEEGSVSIVLHHPAVPREATETGERKGSQQQQKGDGSGGFAGAFGNAEQAVRAVDENKEAKQGEGDAAMIGAEGEAKEPVAGHLLERGKTAQSDPDTSSLALKEDAEKVLKAAGASPRGRLDGEGNEMESPEGDTEMAPADGGPVCEDAVVNGPGEGTAVQNLEQEEEEETIGRRRPTRQITKKRFLLEEIEQQEKERAAKLALQRKERAAKQKKDAVVSKHVAVLEARQQRERAQAEAAAAKAAAVRARAERAAAAAAAAAEKAAAAAEAQAKKTPQTARRESVGGDGRIGLRRGRFVTSMDAQEFFGFRNSIVSVLLRSKLRAFVRSRTVESVPTSSIQLIQTGCHRLRTWERLRGLRPSELGEVTSAEDSEKRLVVVVTEGEENASPAFETVKEKMERLNSFLQTVPLKVMEKAGREPEKRSKREIERDREICVDSEEEDAAEEEGEEEEDEYEEEEDHPWEAEEEEEDEDEEPSVFFPMGAALEAAGAKDEPNGAKARPMRERPKDRGDPQPQGEKEQNAATAQAAQLRLLQKELPELRLEIRSSLIHGLGLFAKIPFPKGSMVVEYVGEVIREQVADLREDLYDAQREAMGSCYMFKLGEESNLIVDATRHGNAARFMNHCCQPNCVCRVVLDEGGTPHIVVFAKRDIHEEEEVTYDYQYETEGSKLACRCGAPGCMGRMN
uniref:[histone H3]-lysine(4) N-trimethyltransferase n=1 Tax=Chromera velia CCMP2878 TaxID=1169474 RepID=A0A0K6SAJ2_9ALVE|eukprot:Cvel_9828.t1-p1 / transcript=Cvel_9828.t1 / gene=Cvel_9828 / organism=Chromera_velia_CCMP2878 / gene_product=Putative histone-lysine N-methyltransferase, putative / transcript_product=Putative histone-lysine N-methyltransferase, putative / location=Cvel_scaffold577:59094-80303(-) / protein_length=3777 / sequence_SO=supercontig / SO=protein_coding / is_pseudo=false